MGFVKVALKGGEWARDTFYLFLQPSAFRAIQAREKRKKKRDVIGICNSISKDSAEARSGGSWGYLAPPFPFQMRPMEPSPDRFPAKVSLYWNKRTLLQTLTLLSTTSRICSAGRWASNGAWNSAAVALIPKGSTYAHTLKNQGSLINSARGLGGLPSVPLHRLFSDYLFQFTVLRWLAMWGFYFPVFY